MMSLIFKSEQKNENHFWQNLLADKAETPPKREDFLKKALRECQIAMDDAYHGLQNTNEPDLIDRYIYELNAANIRYKVILRDIKELAASLTPEDGIKVRPQTARRTPPY